ncbi:MAG: ADP-ribosylglycohydrolase family protein [Gemmatimonadales bacterium]|jgi:ADP-ribosyl-[dinitrogen reductase] hydrolase
MEPLLRFLQPATQPLAPEDGRSRYRGTLLGLAAGNALGCPVEGLTAEQIRSVMPAGMTEIPAEESGVPWDDDVAQTIELGESLLGAGVFDPDDYLRRLIRWMEASGRGIGIQTHRVLSLARAGGRGSEAARAIWESSGRRAAGNGAVMRCAPVALRWRREPTRLIEDAGHSARVTHYDPRCVWSSVAICAAIAHGLAGSHWTLHELAEGLERVGAPNEIAQATRRAAVTDLAGLELDEKSSMGYTVRTMTAGLWAFLNANEFEEAVRSVVNAGGDTDTNGAVVGAVLGARFGAAAIPERWLARLPDRSALESLADRLWEAAENPE